jgi:hypothetical protein
MDWAVGGGTVGAISILWNSYVQSSNSRINELKELLKECEKKHGLLETKIQDIEIRVAALDGKPFQETTK